MLDYFSSGLGGLLVGLLLRGLLVGLLVRGLLVGLLVRGLLVGLLLGGLLVGLLVRGLLVGLLLRGLLVGLLLRGLLVGLLLGGLLVGVLGAFLGWLLGALWAASPRFRAFWGCFSVALGAFALDFFLGAFSLDCFFGAFSLDCFSVSLSDGFSGASSFGTAQKAAFFSRLGLLFLLLGSAAWAAFRLFQDDCSVAVASSSSCVSRRRLGPGVGER